MEATEATIELCCAPLTSAPLSPADATDLAVILKALADPIRLQLISLIAATDTGEMCACDLPALVQRSQPTTSHHLGQLVKAGILWREQRGKWAWFSLRADRLRSVCDAIAGPGGDCA